VADEQLASSGPHTVGDVGRYRLIAELARGGMGIVYLALVRGPGGFNKLFVVKILKAHLAEDPKLVHMFLDEARLAAKLSHPNVVQTIEVGSDHGRHYIAMEHLDGQSHHRVLTRGKRGAVTMPIAFQLHVIRYLLEGLQYAHGATDFDGTHLDLVHRDVSPHNVFVTYDGQVKILDFGIAKAVESSNDTRTGMLKGKVAYMPPEQAAGEPIDRRADVFAAGAMLWEAVVGRRMWDRSLNDLQILHALVAGRIPRPRDFEPGIHESLERVILTATAPRAIERYASAAEMQGEIDEAIRELGLPVIGARDLGKYVSDLFAEERGQIKNVIDSQLRVLRGTSSGEYSRVEMPRLSVHAPPGTPSGEMSFPRSARVPVLGEPSSDAAETSVQVPVPQRVASSAPPVSPSRSGSAIAIVAALVGVLALAGLAGFLYLRDRASRVAAPPAPASAAAATVDPTAPGASAGDAVPAGSGATAVAGPSATTAAATPATTGPVAPERSAAPPPRAIWGNHPAAVPPAAAAPGATATASPTNATAAAAPPATAATLPPALPSASTGRVRQPIDTSNPYNH
jgi:serine/threonine protein kinase